MLWLFEEKLKQRYASFVNVVQGYLKHSASELRRFAAETCAHLLKSKPEQEAELLALLVNKLGDPDPSVSARASQLLAEVLKAHRAMTGVVVEEIQGFTARAPKGSVGAKARLAVACLSQVYLSSELEPVATSLVKMYSRALRGVRGRACPASSCPRGDGVRDTLSARRRDSETPSTRRRGERRPRRRDRDTPPQRRPATSRPTISSAVDRRRARVTVRPEGRLRCLYLQRVRCFVWTGPRGHGPARVRALQLLERLSSEAPVLRSRFERALYAALHAPETRTPSKPALLLNVVFRACKSGDASALLKRCVQVALHNSPQVACALLTWRRISSTSGLILVNHYAPAVQVKMTGACS